MRANSQDFVRRVFVVWREPGEFRETTDTAEPEAWLAERERSPF